MELIRAKKPNLSIDLAPLIDVVFQLLVFFMLTSTFASPAIKMVLPKAKAVPTIEAERLVVSVNEQGEIFINETETALIEFKSALSGQLVSQDNKSIHIKGHEDMPYKMFVQIMDLAKQAGAEHINIVHQKK